jgi:hypothetical protein
MGGACRACGGEERRIQDFDRRNLKERDHLENPGVDERILRWMFRKWNMGSWTGSNWLRIGKDGGHV